jgi:hypothetical protein
LEGEGETTKKKNVLRYSNWIVGGGRRGEDLDEIETNNDGLGDFGAGLGKLGLGWGALGDGLEC